MFTKNDFNSSVYRNDKKKAFGLLTKNVKYQGVFINLIDTVPSQIDCRSNILKTIEEFICKMYKIKTTDKGC